MISIQQFSSIDSVPVHDWNRFVDTASVSLEIAHLKGIELSRINDIKPYYFIAYEEQNVIGIAYGIILNVDFAKLSNSYPFEILETIRCWKHQFMKLKILEMGHIASLGNTIHFDTNYAHDFLKLLHLEIEKIALQEQIDVCLIRDILKEQVPFFQPLTDEGYCCTLGYPIARMELKWNHISGYLEALKSKKRNQLLHRSSQIDQPEIQIEIIEDYGIYADRLTELWTQVAINNNGYEHEKLTPAFFIKMSEELKGRSHLVAIKKDDELIAFGLNLIGDTEYFGMAEGLDYKYRDQYDLYFNNIFESFKVACTLGKKFFNFGITTYDFKCSIGCELEPTFYYIKSFQNDRYSPVYADYICNSIQQPYNNHRAFRNENSHQRIQLKTYRNLIQNQNNEDVFYKHKKYIRTDKARTAGLYQLCPPFETAQTPIVESNGKPVIMLGANAYLGLSVHPEICKAAIGAIEKYGTGCSGSPILNGTLDIHVELGDKMASFVGKESALLFSTGYQTNVGTLSSLTNRNDVVIMDERNHASLIDGALLSRSQLVRYRHNCLDSLEQLLKKNSGQKILVVTDSLFSMEGTIIDLPGIVALKKKYGFRLMLDESHALGIFGDAGQGIASYYQLTDDVDLIMGTFSKAFASVGGFIAGEEKIIDTLRHTSRGHVFSASLPPSSVAAVLAALKISCEEPERRKNLLENAAYLAKGLTGLGFEIYYQGGPIIALYCRNEHLAVAAYQFLFEQGVFVNPVTSPAVPKNHELLRISLMATHTKEMLDHALQIFETLKTPFWPIQNKI